MKNSFLISTTGIICRYNSKNEDICQTDMFQNETKGVVKYGTWKKAEKTKKGTPS